MTRFLPARIFLVSMLAYGCRAVRLGSRASLFGAKWMFRGLEKMGRDAKRWFVARNGRSARGWELVRDHHARLRRATFPFHSVLFFPFSLSRPHFAFFAFLLISCYPGLQLTSRFRLRAPWVSIFPSLPFISALNSRNVLIWLFSSLCLFVFFLWSRTLIDDPSSPTRPAGKHLSIPTLLFSFKRSDWLLPYLCPMLFPCVFLLLFLLMPLYVLGCITYLANMFVHKKCIYV